MQEGKIGVWSYGGVARQHDSSRLTSHKGCLVANQQLRGQQGAEMTWQMNGLR